MPDRRLIGLVAFIVLLLSAAVLSAPYRSIQGPEIEAPVRAESADHGQETAQGKPAGGPSTPSRLPSVLPSRDHGEGESKAEGRGQERPDSEAGILGTSISADSAVAAFTLLLCAATFALYWATRDLVRGADRNAAKQLRAYVCFDFGTAISYNSEFFVVTAFFKNFGQTPAYKVRSEMHAAVSAEIKFDIPQINQSEGSIIGAGAGINKQIRVEIKEGELGDLFKGAKRLYLWGAINYVDAFGNDRNLIIRCIGSQDAVRPDTWTFGPHPLGYEAD